MRKGFTLIEVIISVALVSLLIIYSYQSIAMLKKSNEVYETYYDKISHKTKIHKTLFFDLTQSQSIDIINRNDNSNIMDDNNKFDQFSAQTAHSHFGIINPYIAYIVKDKKLYRLESNKKIAATINDDILKHLKFEIVAVDIKKFKVFASSDSFLIVLNDLIFEVTK